MNLHKKGTIASAIIDTT